MADNPPPIQLAWGYIRFDNNEITLVSTVEDPPKFRMAAAEGGSLGAWSFGRLRSDGQQEEYVLLQGKQDERFRHDPNNHSGELTIHIRNGAIPGDAGFIKVMELRHDGVWMKGLDTLPSPQPGPTPPPPPPPPPPPQDDLARKLAYLQALTTQYDGIVLEPEDVDRYLAGGFTDAQVLYLYQRKFTPTDPNP